MNEQTKCEPCDGKGYRFGGEYCTDCGGTGNRPTKSEAFNGDCLAAMRDMPDKSFDLAIVDPPYGLGRSEVPNAGKFGFKVERNGKISNIKRQPRSGKVWDTQPPAKEYFDELRRVSVNQIIWGANHFISRIGVDSSCWIVWDKVNGESNQSDCELAWTSFKTKVRQFAFMWSGMWQGSPENGRVMQGNKSLNEERLHPTQKPVALYKWLLTNYAKPGDSILDTHLGSGSSRIAAYDLGFDFTGYELDADYFAAQEERFQRHIAQPKLFEAPAQAVEQCDLFA